MLLVVAVIGAAVLLGPASGERPNAELAVDEAPTVAAQASEDEVTWTPVEPGRWRQTPRAPLIPRVAHHLLWSGQEVIVWGGFDVGGLPLLDGATFDPEDGSWTQLPPFDGSDDAPALATWTGTLLLVVSEATTHVFAPSFDMWEVRPAPPVPDDHVIAVLTGTGGGAVLASRSLVAGVLWRPAMAVALDQDGGRWRPLPTPPVDLTDNDLVVADQDRAIIATGSARGGPPRAFAIDLRDPDASWERLPDPPLRDQPPVRLLGGVTGERIVLVGLDAVSGGRTFIYDGRDWRDAEAPPPTLATDAFGQWTNDQLLIWDFRTADSAVFDLAADRWITVPRFPFGAGEFRPAVWTGSDVVTWGGFDAAGGVYAVR